MIQTTAHANVQKELGNMQEQQANHATDSINQAPAKQSLFLPEDERYRLT
jgi:hypothetical protein